MEHQQITDAAITISLALATGMVVQSHDLIHADRHGAVVIPRGAARAVIDAAALIGRREAVVLEAAKAPNTDVAAIKRAMIASAEVS